PSPWLGFVPRAGRPAHAAAAHARLISQRPGQTLNDATTRTWLTRGAARRGDVPASPRGPAGAVRASGRRGAAMGSRPEAPAELTASARRPPLPDRLRRASSLPGSRRRPDGERSLRKRARRPRAVT